MRIRERVVVRQMVVLAIVGAGLIGLAIARTVPRAASDVVVWTTVVGQNPTRVAVDDRTSRAFVLDEGSLARNAGGGIVEGTIHTLDARTGALVRTVRAGTAPDDVAVAERTQRVFVLNSYMHNGGRGTVTVLDAHSGQVVRTTQVGDAPLALALDAGTGRVFVLNQPNSAVTLHTRYAQVSVLDATSGRLVDGLNPAPGDGQEFGGGTLALDARHHWAWLTVSGPRSGAVIEVRDTRTTALVRRIALGPAGPGGGAVLVSTATGRAFVFTGKRVLVLDTARGRILRVIRHPIDGQPVVDERTGRVFVAEQNWNATPGAPNWGRTDAGHLDVLDARTGVLLGTLPIEWPDGLAVDTRSGRLLLIHAGPEHADGSFAGAGRLDVRDGMTGRLLRTIAVGVAPVALTVAGGTSRVLVVNGGGAVQTANAWGWVPAWLRQRIPLLPPVPAPTRRVGSSVSLIALGS